MQGSAVNSPKATDLQCFIVAKVQDASTAAKVQIIDVFWRDGRQGSMVRGRARVVTAFAKQWAKTSQEARPQTSVENPGQCRGTPPGPGSHYMTNLAQQVWLPWAPPHIQASSSYGWLWGKGPRGKPAVSQRGASRRKAQKKQVDALSRYRMTPLRP
ncbi:hypothetical protein BP5796_11102 [Coleophoma crateriformis]|uniref:Uncharacterized protein n=1 Tax=Coleophoma crateriformis TaxID=565419 RepID=A0A3D8QMC9_9HELO|nr:hypothetical protein BP5796_11102 [Coleophoma crateriformis]